jgi:gliding motility-associated-like protein
MKKFSLAFLLFVCTSIGIAQVITPFTIRYQTTQKGGIRYISNTAVSCNGGGGCNTARAENPPAGTGTDNGFTAAYVDIDGDASTFQSSSDSLDLASCSEVLWAGLYWGAENQSGGSNYANRNQCKIKVNSGAYTNLTADAFQDNAIGFNTYHCFKDITALVQGAGIKSRFTVANVAARVGGTNRFGGWSIVVVYKNDLQPMRNLTVFNGLSNVSGANPTTDVTVSGFLTPLSGPITFEIGNITYDGDRSSTGDQLQFNGGSGFVNISDADNNANDIFNSTLCYNGVAKTAPFINPGYLNTLGYDADIFIPNNVAKNYIGNSATSATLRLTTGGETFLTQVVSMAIDVYEPDLRASIRVTDINGGTANPGDILEYRVKGINIGSDPSVNSFITDTIERNANYIPNSIRIIHGPNLGLKTDVVGDDQAEYTAGNRLIKVRIGTGATAATGGTVINSPTGADSTIFTYSVMVTNSCTKVACDNVIDARAYILGTGAVSTNTFSNGSNPGIFDAFGCPIPGTTSTPITATACATPTAGASSPGVCAGANFTLSASSDLEVTYLWSGPNSFTSVDQNPVLGPSTSSMSGVYSVTLIAYPGCSRTATTSVNINALPTLTTSASSTLFCSGVTSTLTASGAATYTWNPGALIGASVAVTPTATTIYTVTATNASGCSNTGTINLTVNAIPTLTATTSSSAICVGGTATLTSSGANTYTWNPGASTGTTVVVTPTATTVYTVTGTNASGCTNTSTVSLTVNSLPTLTATASSSSLCIGSSSSLTATGATSYTWNPSASTGPTVVVSPTVTTIYTVTGTNASGCINSETVSLTVNTLPTAGITNSTGTTTLNCTTTSINFTATGGTSYTWSGGLGSLATATITNPGTYSVTATGANGCSSQSVITVSQNTTAPTVGITNSTGTTTINCTTTSINVTATGGTSYTWSGGLGSTATATITNPGTYTVTATGANGCSSQSVITVSQNTTAPTAGITNSTGTTTLNCTITSINVTATGGTSYTWSGGLGSLATATITNPGTYTVTATGANGCSSQSVIAVTQNTTSPTAGITNSTGTTTLNCTTTSINVTATGGTSYTWSGGLGSTATATITNPGTYTVTATGANGCSSQSVISVSQNTTAPTAGITNSTGTTTLNCTTTSINVTATGGTSYTWSGGLGSLATATITNPGTYTVTATGANGCSSQSVITVSQNTTAPTVGITNSTGTTTLNCTTTSINLTATGGTSYTWSGGLGSLATATITNPGTYSVTATGANGCSSQSVIAVTQNTTTPTAGITNSTGTTTLNCTTTSINVTATGGTSYTWSGGLGSLATATITNPGTYTVTATGANGCSSQSVIAVTQNTTTPTTGITNSTGTTTLNCTTTSINVTATGGTSYSWSGGLGSLATATITNPGTYTVTATGANGCSSQSVITVTQNTTAPIVGITNNTGTTELTCSTTSINVTATGGTSYTWSGGLGITATATITNPGTYTVTATGANGCSSQSVISVTQNTTAPIVIASSSSSSICAGSSVTLTASGATSYTWNPGNFSGSTLTVSPTSTTIYTLTGLAANGCTNTTTLNLTVNSIPILTLTASSTTVCSGGTITLTASGASTYTWDPVSLTGPSITSTITSTTVYSVTGESSEGCIGSSSITVSLNNCPTAVNDATNTIENIPVTGNAAANDSETIGGTFTSGTPSAGTGTLTMDPATGQYTFTPSAGFAGVSSTSYTLCNGSPIVCSSAVITVTVFPTLLANPDAVTTTPSVSTSGTLTTNDNGVVPGATYSVSVTQLPPSTGTITIDPATGQYTFTPNPTYTGSTTTTYTICNTSVNPIVCSSTTISILVGNVPVAVADATTTIENTPVSGDASSNDSGAIPTLNPVFTCGPLTAGTGTLTMDPATGQYTYTPAPGFTGTTSATYTLCNLSSPPCSTTTITFTIFPTLVANPDVINTTPSVTVTGTLTTNDGGVVPGGTYSVTVTQPTSTTGTITVDPATGGYTFTPNPTFTGTTTTTYTLCNTSVNPIVCSTTTITIIVGTPKIAVAKTVVSTIKTNATTYQSVFSFNLANLGNTIGTNVQLVDNLNNTFPAPITYTVVGVTANSPLTSNAAYDGNTTVAMLSGTNSLNPLQNSIVTLTVNFSPNSTTLTTLSNSGVGSTANNPDPTGTGPHTSSDTTDAGTSPDPDGDGIPNEPGENDPTTFGQQIAASKTASTLTKVNATTFQTVFTFNVANVGPVTATNVQLTDNLNNTFLAPMTYTVVGLNANTPLTANGAYDGSTNIALLSGSNSLVSGANALVTLTVNFNTNSSTATTISNIGIASTATNPDPSGFGPHVSIDTTGTGTNPDPDDDGIPNEPGENDPTTFGQQIGAAKTSSGFSKLNATTFQTVFTFNVANYGAVAATNVQLTDDLNSTFPAPMTFTVVGLNANTPLTANAGYNGSSNIAMLSGTNTLNTSQSALVTLTVNFSPNTTTLTSLSNIGVASTSNLPDPTGGGTHTSTDTTGAGTDPDPDGDGNPNEPEENNPTFFGQQVAGAKTASTLIKVNATTYQTVFTFNIANVGPVTATNVQLTDNLNNTFLAPMTYTVVGLNANSPLTTNAGYNGNTNIALLSGSNTLNASQSSIVTLTVNFSPNSSTVTLLSNIGIVSSSDAPDPTGGGTHTSTDTTGAGTNPDPDGDGNPNEPGENDPITFGQQIGVSKNALSTVKLENGDNQTTFVFTLQNLGVVSATNVQLVDNLNNTFPSPITYNVVSVTSSSGLSTNTSYDGGTDINLLTGTNTLSVGSIQTVTLVVNFNMNGSSLSSLYNYGIATSSSSNGTIISSDTTNVGNNPDTDDDGNPNEPGENIPTEFSPVKENPDEPESFNIPQGFSPNGDGVNDVFVIRGISIYPNNKLTIINRWGNVVFEKDNYDNTWDGKSTQGIRFGGDELPDGTYFYILDLGNNEKPYKGFIYISKTIK